MYTLNLSAEEFQALVDMLECSISELHTEIVHTDQRDLKEILKHRKQVLVRMLASLSEMEPERLPTAA